MPSFTGLVDGVEACCYRKVSVSMASINLAIKYRRDEIGESQVLRAFFFKVNVLLVTWTRALPDGDVGRHGRIAMLRQEGALSQRGG